MGKREYTPVPSARLPSRTHCVECGALKPVSHAHNAQRCWPCREAYGLARDLAVRAVTRARNSGELPNAKTLVCVDCGSQARDYDHRDYSKPLSVQPVCRPCNFKRGPAAWVRPDGMRSVPVRPADGSPWHVKAEPAKVA